MTNAQADAFRALCRLFVRVLSKTLLPPYSEPRPHRGFFLGPLGLHQSGETAGAAGNSRTAPAAPRSTLRTSSRRVPRTSADRGRTRGSCRCTSPQVRSSRRTLSRQRSWMRSLSSAAALSVKVKATMFAGVQPPPPSFNEVSRVTTRRATTSVLPEPAHAISWRLPSTWSIARCCASVNSMLPAHH